MPSIYASLIAAFGTVPKVYGGSAAVFGRTLLVRDGGVASGAAATAQDLGSQWTNPSDVSSILLIIGGDVVGKALAQSTGCFFTPICFSFGWVAYAFSSVVSIIGEGKLLPPPDYPAKVYNLRSGYGRDNKNWVVGRILRDHEAGMGREDQGRMGSDAEGFRITVYLAERNHNKPTTFSYSWMHLTGALVMLLQFGVAAIPAGLHGEWDVLFITGVGTLLAQVAGILPQWVAEKLPNRQRSREVFALTTGNGSRDVMVVIGNGSGLDLEELAAAQSPRNRRPWEKFTNANTLTTGHPFPAPEKAPPPLALPKGLGWSARARSTMTMGLGNSKTGARSGTLLRAPRTIFGLPAGFALTAFVSLAQSLAWLALLVNLAAQRNSQAGGSGSASDDNTNSWYILAVGLIGMFQNAAVASWERSPARRNLPLTRLEVIRTRKVMDGLMDFQVTYGCGRPLVREFFPGDLTPVETHWWDAATAAESSSSVSSPAPPTVGSPISSPKSGVVRDPRDEYDDARNKDPSRGIPRRLLPPFMPYLDEKNPPEARGRLSHPGVPPSAPLMPQATKSPARGINRTTGRNLNVTFSTAASGALSPTVEDVEKAASAQPLMATKIFPAQSLPLAQSSSEETGGGNAGPGLISQLLGFRHTRLSKTSSASSSSTMESSGPDNLPETTASELLPSPQIDRSRRPQPQQISLDDQPRAVQPSTLETPSSVDFMA